VGWHSCYEWKRRFQTHGFDRLKDLPPIHKSHPPDDAGAAAAADQGSRAGAREASGVGRGAMLALEGIRVSAINVQKILNDNCLGTRIERWFALEAMNAEKAIEVSAEQAAFLEKLNPVCEFRRWPRLEQSYGTARRCSISQRRLS
jgi:hypothetical protein